MNVSFVEFGLAKLYHLSPLARIVRSKCNMEQSAVSVKTLTESCVAQFEQLVARPDPRHTERLESRMADFNLWADGVAALARPGASLDSRLQWRTGDLELVKSILRMLDDSLAYYASLEDSDPNVNGAILNLDSAIQNLALIGVAIRRTGKASRNRRAARTFKPDAHQELRRHLECVILLRPSEKGPFRLEKDECCVSVAGLDDPKLSDLQKRLIDANLRRRHNFLVAQKRAVVAQMSSSQHMQNLTENLLQEGPSPVSNQNKGDRQHSAPIAPAAREKTPHSGPSMSGFSHASTAEGPLKYTPGNHNTPPVAKTQITSIASLADFPKPPLVSLGRALSQCPLCCQSLPIETFSHPETWR